MFAIIAFIPIIVTIIVMAGFNWPAKIALPLAWLITAVVCFFGWQMDFITIAAHTVSGFLTSIDTIVIILGAILIMNTLKHSGGISGGLGYGHIRRLQRQAGFGGETRRQNSHNLGHDH